MAKYHDALDTLRLALETIQGMQTGSTSHWKPSQAGLMIATTVVLRLQDVVLKMDGYKFFLTGRLLQDCLENLVSVVRQRKPVPNAYDMKFALPLSSINRYVDKVCETRRCLSEAEEVYYAGHVIECAVEAAENARFDFLAFVLQTTAIDSAPHEVKITVCDAVVDRASYSCKAGKYKCKHIVAVLLHINAARTFDKLSPTHQPQKWGKEHKERVKQKYEPRAIVDLPCAKKAKIKKTPQLEGNILERLLENVSYQSAARMNLDRGTELEAMLEPTIELGCSTSEPASRDLTLIGSLKELRSFLGISGEVTTEELLEHLQESKSHEDIIMTEKLTRDQAKSSLWLRHRVGMITASIAYSIFTRVKTLRTKMGPHDLTPLLKKVMRQNNVCTATLCRGSALEGSARKCYQSQRATHENLVVRQCGLFIMEGRPYMGASPDGLVKCNCCPERVKEIKYPESMKKFLEENIEKNKEKALTQNLKRTTTYFCQVQVQMGITAVQHADLFVFVNEEDNICIPVLFDEAYFSDVVERSSYFFEQYILPHVLST
ncbi:uncharacterized protein LOC142588637 [Dermacentor variabilis]|uniref:uncharacterized protein LOC142588637 n=1 Tax=Dermacentor variabilis TaxID=34621 RepID=UPI003F5C71C0